MEGVLSLWFLSALLLLFGPFAGQRKRGLRVGVFFNYRYARRPSNIFFSGTNRRSRLQRRSISCGPVMRTTVALCFKTTKNGLGEELTETDQGQAQKVKSG